MACTTEIRFRVGAGIFFLLATASRPSLGPTQPGIEWVQGAFSLGVKRPGNMTDHSPPSGVEVKNACAIRLYSMMLI